MEVETVTRTVTASTEMKQPHFQPYCHYGPFINTIIRLTNHKSINLLIWIFFSCWFDASASQCQLKKLLTENVNRTAKIWSLRKSFAFFFVVFLFSFFIIWSVCIYFPMFLRWLFVDGAVHTGPGCYNYRLSSS